MVDKKQMQLANGLTIDVDIVQLFERKEKVLIAILGLDFDTIKDGFHFEIEGEVELTRVGKLLQQTRWPVQYLQKVLLMEEWDWKKHPNPELVTIARKSKIIL